MAEVPCTKGSSSCNGYTPGNLVYVNGSTWRGMLRLWVMYCCNIYADDITLYFKCDQASGL